MQNISWHTFKAFLNVSESCRFPVFSFWVARRSSPLYEKEIFASVSWNLRITRTSDHVCYLDKMKAVRAETLPAGLHLSMNTVSILKRVRRHRLGSLTSLLATLLIMILSGRSMVLAMVSTTRRAWRRVGQSNRLYITFCFLVHNRSNYSPKHKGLKRVKSFCGCFNRKFCFAVRPAVAEIYLKLPCGVSVLTVSLSKSRCV